MATYVLTIDGVTKNIQPGWTIEETASGRAIFTFEVNSLDASYRAVAQKEVIFTEDGIVIFGGYIDTPAEEGLGKHGVTPIVNKITAVDYNSLADRRYIIDGGFPTGYTMLQCMTSLAGYLPAGFAIDAAQTTGSTLLAPLVYDAKILSAILDELAIVMTGLSGVSHLWKINYSTKKIRMFPVGTFAAPVSMTEASLFAEGDVTVEPTRQDYANRVYVLVGSGPSEVTDTFTGDGVTTDFQLSYPLVSHKGSVTNAAVAETLAVQGTGFDLAAFWLYITSSGKIRRIVAPANGNAISITYTAQFPVVVMAEDAGEQATNGLWETAIAKSDTFSKVTGTAMAAAYLARTISRSQTVKYRTRQVGIQPGQTQTITYAKRNLSGGFLITDITTSHIGNLVYRDVTAISGTTYLGSWRDMFKAWGSSEGSTGSAGTTAGTTTTTIVNSGISGIGTANKIVKFVSALVIGDSIFSESGTVGTVTGTLNVTGGLTAATQDQITRVGTLVSGATGAGFTIALTTSTVTGNLPYARMPSGSGTWTGVPTISGILTLQSDLTIAGNTGTTTYASQTTGWRVTAAGAADFRYLYTDELYAKSFIADLEQALAGGQIICKSVTTLGAAFTVPAAGGTATLTVKDLPSAANMAVFESGDYVAVRSFSRAAGSLTIGDAYGVVTAYADQAGGLQTWTFTRGSGGNAGTLATSTVIAIDSIVLDYGTTGMGYYEVNAIDGLYGINSPYAQVVSWATSPVSANRTVRARFGKLTGITGAANDWGLFAGSLSTLKYLYASSNAFEIHGISLSLYDITTEVIKLNPTVPSIALGNPLPTAYGTGIGIWMGKDTVYKFRVGDPSGNRISWDNTNLTLVSENLTISSAGVAFSAPPVGYGSTYGFRFNTGFAGTNFNGLFAEEPSSAIRNLYVLNSTNQAAKTAQIYLYAGANAIAASIVVKSDSTTASIDINCSTYTNTATAAIFYGQITCGAVWSSDPLHVQIAGANVQRIDTNGDWRPETDNTQRVGLATHRYTLIRGVTITAGDLGFENGWAFTEGYKVGIEEPGIALVNPAGEVAAFFGENGFHGKPHHDVHDLPHAITTSEERAEMDAHPHLRVKKHDKYDKPIFKTTADVRPMPGAHARKTTKQRRLV